jgi:hypothetical protein
LAVTDALASSSRSALVDDEQRDELDGLGVVRQSLDLDDIAGGDFELLAARADHCVHVSTSWKMERTPNDTRAGAPF